MLAWFSAIWAYDEVRALVISVLSTGIVGVVATLLAARPRIQWGITNNNHFLLPQENGSLLAVHTRNFTLSNQGRKVANDVEVVLNWKPQHIEHYPHIPIQTATNNDSRYVLTIAKLNPKEFINFSMLDATGPMPEITYVRASGYSAQRVTISPQRVFPAWFNISAFVAMIIGVIATIYIVVLLFI